MAEIDSRKAALIAEMEVSRGEIRGALRRCESNLNPAEVMRRSVRSSPGAWLSAAALLGLALSQVVRLGSRRSAGGESGARRREDWLGPGAGGGAKDSKGGGWMLSLGRLAFDLLKPTIADWATEQLSNLARAKVFTGDAQARNGVRRGVRKPETDAGHRRSQDH
jgi:hypothetical protein